MSWSWSWRWRRSATNIWMPTVLEEEAQGVMAKGTRDPDLDRGLPPSTRASRAMSRSSSGFDARDEHGHLQHTSNCDQRDCFVVQGKKQEPNTGSKPKMPDHYRCTMTCAFCGKRKHYEDECYPKQRLSAKLRGEDPGKGSGKGSGSGGGMDKNESGKGKSKGRGKGQDKSQGGRGGGADRQQDKDNKNQDKFGGNPNPNPGGNSEPSGGQSGSGPTTRLQTQAQLTRSRGGPGHGTVRRTRTSKQAGKALRSQGHPHARVM